MKGFSDDSFLKLGSKNGFRTNRVWKKLIKAIGRQCKSATKAEGKVRMTEIVDTDSSTYLSLSSSCDAKSLNETNNCTNNLSIEENARIIPNGMVCKEEGRTLGGPVVIELPNNDINIRNEKLASSFIASSEQGLNLSTISKKSVHFGGESIIEQIDVKSEAEDSVELLKVHVYDTENTKVAVLVELPHHVADKSDHLSEKNCENVSNPRRSFELTPYKVKSLNETKASRKSLRFEDKSTTEALEIDANKLSTITQQSCDAEENEQLPKTGMIQELSDEEDLSKLFTKSIISIECEAQYLNKSGFSRKSVRFADESIEIDGTKDVPFRESFDAEAAKVDIVEPIVPIVELPMEDICRNKSQNVSTSESTQCVLQFLSETSSSIKSVDSVEGAIIKAIGVDLKDEENGDNGQLQETCMNEKEDLSKLFRKSVISNESTPRKEPFLNESSSNPMHFGDESIIKSVPAGHKQDELETPETIKNNIVNTMAQNIALVTTRYKDTALIHKIDERDKIEPLNAISIRRSGDESIATAPEVAKELTNNSLECTGKQDKGTTSMVQQGILKFSKNQHNSINSISSPRNATPNVFVQTSRILSIPTEAIKQRNQVINDSHPFVDHRCEEFVRNDIKTKSLVQERIKLFSKNINRVMSNETNVVKQQVSEAGSVTEHRSATNLVVDDQPKLVSRVKKTHNCATQTNAKNHRDGMYLEDLFQSGTGNDFIVKLCELLEDTPDNEINEDGISLRSSSSNQSEDEGIIECESDEMDEYIPQLGEISKEHITTEHFSECCASPMQFTVMTIHNDQNYAPIRQIVPYVCGQEGENEAFLPNETYRRYSQVDDCILNVSNPADYLSSYNLSQEHQSHYVSAISSCSNNRWPQTSSDNPNINETTFTIEADEGNNEKSYENNESKEFLEAFLLDNKTQSDYEKAINEKFVVNLFESRSKTSPSQSPSPNKTIDNFKITQVQDTLHIKDICDKKNQDRSYLMSDFDNEVNIGSSTAIDGKNSSISTRTEAVNPADFDQNQFLRDALGSAYNIIETSTTEDSNFDMAEIEPSEENNNEKRNSLDKAFFILRQKADIQGTIMRQASKALEICRNSKEFSASSELVEAEKILLTATCKYDLLRREIQKIKYENLVLSNVNNLGDITINNLHFPLNLTKTENMQYMQYFVCILSNEDKVFASKAVEANYEENFVSFGDTFKFKHLNPNFIVTIDLYNLKIKKPRKNDINGRLCLNKKVKNICSSRKKMFYKDIQTFTLMETMVLKTAFNLCGSVRVIIDDMYKGNQWKVQKFQSSPLSGTVELNAQVSNVNIYAEKMGFLTIGSEVNGHLMWNRRWCILKGSDLKCYNYPTDEDLVDCKFIVNLKYSLSDKIDVASREHCAKPRTLILETAEPCDDLKRNFRTVKYFLCADNNSDMQDWLQKLNSVVGALLQWNELHFLETNV